MTKTNISVVDDDELQLALIEEFFGINPQYNFRYYKDAVLFLEDLSVDLDLVIIDVHMPDFDIVDAVRMIDIKSPMAYIIVLSADKVWDTMKQLANLGIFRFCEKGETFLDELKESVAAAHRKITIRKELLDHGI